MTKKEKSPSSSSQPVKIALKDLPEEIRKDLLTRAPAQIQHKRPSAVQFEIERSAPLPDPEELREYENLLPGSFERILKLHEDLSRGKLELANKNLDNRRYFIEKRAELTELAICNKTRNEKRGQWMALPIATLILLLIGFAIYRHSDWEVIACLSAIFGGNIATIFFANYQNKKSDSKNASSEAEEK